jgi:myo-inositol 2-dehydrogenase/D-chiro-inositol 1-dehydrogenase
MSRYAGAYTAEISAFVTAVKSRRVPPTTGEDGIAALVLAEAAHRAAHEKRRVLIAEIAA